MVTAVPEFKRKIAHASLSLCFFILSGCTESDSTHLKAHNYDHPNSLMPTYVWLDNALKQFTAPESGEAFYQIYTTIEPRKAILSLAFDSNKVLNKARVNDSLKTENTLLFEMGRLTYSHHVESSGRMWMVAYANNKPYAAALHLADNWEAVEPFEVPIDQNMIRESTLVACQHEELEKNNRFDHRILTEKAELKGKIEGKQFINYRLNARKGDFLRVSLENTSNQVFFTFANQSNARMEYQNWQGTAESTGDMTIQVFSANEKAVEEPFTLSVNLQSRAEIE